MARTRRSAAAGGAAAGRAAAGRVLAGLALATLLGACGAPGAAPLSPRSQLGAGLASLGALPALRLDIHFEASASQLAAVAPSPYDATIVGTSVVIEGSTTDGRSLSALVRAVEDAANPAAELALIDGVATDLAVEEGGHTLLELRVVRNFLYGRADVEAILALLHQDPAVIARGLPLLPKTPAYAAIRAVLSGGWVSFNLAHALAADQSASQAATPAQVRALLHALGMVFDRDVQVSAGGTGPAGSTLVRVSANVQTLLAGLGQAFDHVDPQASRQGIFPGGALAAVQSRVFYATATLAGSTLAGSTLTCFELNASQFLTKDPASHPVEVAVGISHPPVALAAPTGAVALTPAQLKAGEFFLSGAMSQN